MRLAPILIQEGRKEDLFKKYEEKFNSELSWLVYILSYPFLSQTNFKYGDFVLKNLHSNSSVEEFTDIIKYIKEFDRFQGALEEKDINKYDLDGLKLAIDAHKESSKSHQRKIDANGAKKLYEDINILIVKPLTYEASCKYGAGTKWCTTMAGQSSYFQSHTADQQALYYIILKKFTRDNQFYKIAVHMTPTSEVWYDSTDERMSDREKEVFSLGAPKMIETIRKDYQKLLKEKGEVFFKKLFDYQNYKFENVSQEFKTNHYIGIEFEKSELLNTPNNAVMELNISVDEENIDSYLVRIVYEVTSDKIIFNIRYANDYFEPEFDFGIASVSTNLSIGTFHLQNPTNDSIKSIFNELCYTIEKQVIYRMKINTKFMSFIHDNKSVWNPNRRSYGYTFKKNAGMVKKLVDYLDSGKTGTKLDFLTNIGNLEKGELNGKPFYRRTGEKRWGASSVWRGQHSGFFNSAKLAGILDYDKKGNQFILKKGPNFEKFKSGQLSAL